ncbi:MAG TPA: branched-chain-amino-acid transaminase [Firmicutes bacterium]|nr:branched-chain-amino-acid transaminase [Bacillota bacterium]
MNPNRVVYVDGEFVPACEAKVSVFDHGFLYGDGVFEGIRAYNGRVFRLTEHLDRLYESARAIALEIPVSWSEMERITLETVRRNGLRDAYIRLVVSRGVGDLGLDPRKCQKPTIVCIADSITLYPKELYETGLKVMTVPTRRVAVDALNPRVKSLNYLNNILAKIEANLVGMAEVIMLSPEGYVVEATGDNVFIVKKSKLITPPSYMGILEGITRATIMELAPALGLTVVEQPLTRHDLYVADECFLTGTAAEAIPVVEIDGRKIRDGKPGKYTLELIELFRDYANSHGTPVYEP